jgi:signal transduction histidine kinase
MFSDEETLSGVSSFYPLWYNSIGILYKINIKMEIINDLNIKKQARDLGVSVWQTPGFLFIVLGFVAASVMSATFYLSRSYNDPAVLIISESIVASIILIVGTSVIRLVYQIAKINKLKSEFVAVASHQLRTPISGIRWETELLLSKLKKGLSEKQIKNIESIKFLSSKMARLVNDLLDVAKIDQKRLILKKNLIDISKIVKEVVSEVSPFIRSRNIELVLRISDKIPETVGDPERIRMVVDNMINNSIKYSLNKGKIEIILSKKDENIVFSVKDNGAGIPVEQQDRVFEKFFRSDNAVKYQTEGTGLGLYIAKNIIDQSGGEIWFDSVENSGSIFSFSLPIKQTGQQRENSYYTINSNKF